MGLEGYSFESFSQFDIIRFSSDEVHPSAELERQLTISKRIKDRALRVLIVEDDALIALDIEMMLNELGAEVVGIAMTAKEAARLAALHQPDFATMDVNIKGDRDGIYTAIDIYDAFGIRSIFISAYGNSEARHRGEAAHPLNWLQKPVDFHMLKETLRMLD